MSALCAYQVKERCFNVRRCCSRWLSPASHSSLVIQFDMQACFVYLLCSPRCVTPLSAPLLSVHLFEFVILTFYMPPHLRMRICFVHSALILHILNTRIHMCMPIGAGMNHASPTPHFLVFPPRLAASQSFPDIVRAAVPAETVCVATGVPAMCWTIIHANLWVRKKMGRLREMLRLCSTAPHAHISYILLMLPCCSSSFPSVICAIEVHYAAYLSYSVDLTQTTFILAPITKGLPSTRASLPPRADVLRML